MVSRVRAVWGAIVRPCTESNFGRVGFQHVVQQAATFRPVGDVIEISDRSDGENAKSTFYSSAFLEHLLRLARPAVIPQALDCYYGLLNTAQWDSNEKRGTFVLRCDKAVLNYWRYLSIPSRASQHWPMRSNRYCP